MMEIREAGVRDLAAIRAIYTHYVATSTCTYQLEAEGDAERVKWFERHAAAGLPVTVAVMDGEVAGWGALSRFLEGGGFRFTLEDSVYVHPERIRRGIGRALLGDLLIRAEKLPCRAVIAVISADQLASIALHAAAGFLEAGRLRDVGYKFGRWLDVMYMQKMIAGSGRGLPGE